MVSLVHSIYHWVMAFFGNIFFGFPSRRLFVVGVTGTKGKSTVLELMAEILRRANKKIAMSSSVYFQINDKKELNLTNNTMPGRFFIQKFLRRAVKAGCQYALIEVTSQGVIQFRHKFIDWDAAVFLNLMPEHIEAHGSFEKYREAKIRFFRSLANSKKPKKYFFINEDDSNQHFFVEATRSIPAKEIVFFSRGRFIQEELGGRYNLNSEEGRQRIGDWLLADFNLENAAAAVSFARSQNIDGQIILDTLNNFSGLPGRFEFIQKSPFLAVIDYAHTPDSLEKVYQALKSMIKAKHSSHSIICVLGSAGGGRDKWKRPVMGEIAAEYCQTIILTNEDPYDENPEIILDEIELGFSSIQNLTLRQRSGLMVSRVEPSKFKIRNIYKIIDRQEAIKKAVSLAKKGDAVIVTGKGSEPWIHLARGQRIPWSERRALEKALQEINL